MKFYVFDIKSILSLTNKTEDKKLKNILFPFMGSAYCNLVLFDKAAFAKDNWSADHSYKEYKEGSFYIEELFFVFEELNERYLNKYLVKFNKFKEDVAKLDIINNPEEYHKFYSNINRHLMSELLIGSYRIVEDFDVKLKEAESLGVINPIEYILAKETEHKLND